jgi:hypothetical protein
MAQDAVLIDKTNDDYSNDGGYDVLQTFYLNDFLNEVFYFAHLTLDRNICKGINFNYIPNRFLKKIHKKLWFTAFIRTFASD